MRKAIAIDFDGCLCENAGPEIGAPNWAVIHAAQLAQREGAALILWTCRNGDLLTSAVEWCREHGLIFDAINENLPERLEHYGSDTRKISADEYWDDLAVRVPAPPNDPMTMEELREMEKEPEPIYIPGLGWRICWGIEDSSGKLALKVGVTARIHLENYGNGFVAYRRKPEEGTT